MVVASLLVAQLCGCRRRFGECQKGQDVLADQLGDPTHPASGAHGNGHSPKHYRRPLNVACHTNQ